jgi:hypothetical protein
MGMIPAYAQKTIEILEKLRVYITDDSDMMYSAFELPVDLRKEIDDIAGGLRRGDMKKMETAYLDFLPTSAFQEHSMQNGWSDEYLKLAEEFDGWYGEYGKSVN